MSKLQPMGAVLRRQSLHVCVGGGGAVMWRKGQVSSGIRFVALKHQRLQRHLCVQPQDSAVSSLPLRPPVPSPWFQVLGVLLWTGRVHRAISCLKGSWGQFLPCVRGIHFLWILRGQDVPGLCESLFSGCSRKRRPQGSRVVSPRVLWGGSSWPLCPLGR